ncbi:hypothetical protein [Bdellovibrio bacteriovorus]
MLLKYQVINKKLRFHRLRVPKNPEHSNKKALTFNSVLCRAEFDSKTSGL